METEKKDETVDSTNDTEAVTEETEEKATEDTTGEAVETVDEEKSKLIETNKKLYARAKAAEEALKNAKKNQSEESPASFDPLVDAVLAVKSLEAEEISVLGAEARSLGVDPVKYIKSTAGKAHLDSIRREKKSKEAAPETPGRSPVFKKYTQADLSKMSVAELEKIIPRSDY